jgi:hypothetical protein
MKRAGWLEPWRAGWINLKAMLLYGADFFLMKPGLALLLLGLSITLPATFGPVTVGPATLSSLLVDVGSDFFGGWSAELLSGLCGTSYVRLLTGMRGSVAAAVRLRQNDVDQFGTAASWRRSGAHPRQYEARIAWSGRADR